MSKKRIVELVFVNAFWLWVCVGLTALSIETTCELLNAQNSWSVFFGFGGIIVCCMIPYLLGTVLYDYNSASITKNNFELKKEKENE